MSQFTPPRNCSGGLCLSKFYRHKPRHGLAATGDDEFTPFLDRPKVRRA